MLAPAVDGPLFREPVPQPSPAPPRWRKVFLPKTSDASTLNVDERTTHISGVTPPAADAVCQWTDGSIWPCGRAALHAFRMFIGGRAVECYFPTVDAANDITAPCRIGRTDLGLWLVTQGWDMPNDLSTDVYRSVAEDARCPKRGLWRWTQPEEASCPTRQWAQSPIFGRSRSKLSGQSSTDEGASFGDPIDRRE